MRFPTRSDLAARTCRWSWGGSPPRDGNRKAPRPRHRRRSRTGRRDRPRTGGRRPRRDLHVSLGERRSRRAAQGTMQATIHHKPLRRWRSTSPTRPRSTHLPKTSSVRPSPAFVHNAGQSYDSLAMMMDQAKAEAAMQVELLVVHAHRRRADAPDDARARRPRRRDRLDYGVAGQPGQCRLRGVQSRPARLRTHAWRSRSRRTGVTVNYVAPGLHRHRDDGALCQISRADGSPDPGAALCQARGDRRHLVAFLLSPQASYITGAVLPVDGGLSAAIGIQR